MNRETLKRVLRQSFESGPPPTRPRALELIAHDFGGHTIPRPIKKSSALQYLLA